MRGTSLSAASSAWPGEHSSCCALLAARDRCAGGLWASAPGEARRPTAGQSSLACNQTNVCLPAAEDIACCRIPESKSQ